MKINFNALNIKLALTGLFLSYQAVGVSAQEDTLENADSSFKAPLVTESLLLDISHGSQTIIVGERGHILKATNNSPEIDDFKQIIAPTRTTLTAVYNLGQNVWAVGHDATIIRSTDSGNSWELVQTFPELDRPLLDVYFFDENEGIAIGAYGLFYRTLDGGMNWQQESHPSVLSEDDKEYLDSIKDDEAFYLEELSFISPHFNQLNFANGQLYLAGEAGLVAVSSDRGNNWERLDIDYFGSFFAINVLPSNEVMVAGLRGNMFVQSNDDWRKINTCVTTSLNSIEIDGSNAHLFGNNGVILKVSLNQLNSSELQSTSIDGCRRHVSVSQTKTDFSDPIADGIPTGSHLLTVTASGLKQVVAN